MPTYVYEVVEKDGTGGERFEVSQRMTDPPVTRHPQTDQPVRRVITVPRIAGQRSPMHTDRVLADDRRLERLGFTKYVKSGDGAYEKKLGTGPRVIKKK